PVGILQQSNRIAGPERVYNGPGNFSRLVEAFYSSEFAASVHYDQYVGRNSTDTAGRMKNIVFGNYEITLGHVRKETSVFIECQNVELYLFGLDPLDIFWKRSRRRRNATALGGCGKTGRQNCHDGKS